MSIDGLWERLRRHQGQEFATKRGLPFTYNISGEVLHPSRTKYNISKTEFAKALTLVPFDGPGIINRTVRGPAYVWALLHDQRIRSEES